MSERSWTQRLADAAAVTMFMTIALTAGALGGWFLGYGAGSQGHFVDVHLSNSSVTTNSASGSVGYPCTGSDMEGHVRCTFANKNATWICEYRPSRASYDPGAKAYRSGTANESCREVNSQ